ncbi:uncharacterized protein MELLADRAFT_101106 [Melampsora larici-populina 98AG31]|uniref:Uncharacterized protein n=1 Tax=Melampsora larici-populina (strain 98AG31 / pathotype 3-4-7) TaxID=747676 RepID=F4R3M7_MELLP|nr:uncharacterized protein MELLADRAFT_101106 [Melampsora larici-populina 98AG31]EGG12656.1 hypothetical protein MELLADRAFT_101106 [Melampsora larici-populina 98AG31]
MCFWIVSRSLEDLLTYSLVCQICGSRVHSFVARVLYTLLRNHGLRTTIGCSNTQEYLVITAWETIESSCQKARSDQRYSSQYSIVKRMRTRPSTQNGLETGISPSLWATLYTCSFLLSQAGGLHVEDIGKACRSVAPSSLSSISRITDGKCGGGDHLMIADQTIITPKPFTAALSRTLTRQKGHKNLLEESNNLSFESQVSCPDSPAQWPTKSGKDIHQLPEETRRQGSGNNCQGIADVGNVDWNVLRHRILHSIPISESDQSGLCQKASASPSRSRKDILNGHTATSVERPTTDPKQPWLLTFLLWLWSKVMVTFQSLLRIGERHEATRLSSLSCGKGPFEPDRRERTTLRFFQRKHSDKLEDLKDQTVIHEVGYKPHYRLSLTEPPEVTPKPSRLAVPKTNTKERSNDQGITETSRLASHGTERHIFVKEFYPSMELSHQPTGEKSHVGQRKSNGAEAAVNNLDREIYLEIKSSEPFESHNSWIISQPKSTPGSMLDKININSRKSMSSKTFKFLEILRKSDLSNLDGYETMRLQCIQAFGTDIASAVTRRPKKIWRGSERQKKYDLSISRLLQSVLKERELSEKQLTIAWKLKNRIQPLVFTHEEWEKIKRGIQIWKTFPERQSDQTLAMEFLNISNKVGFLPDKSDLRMLLWKLKYRQSLNNIEHLKTKAMVLCYKKNILATNIFFENALWYVMKTPDKFLIGCSQRQTDAIKRKLERFAFTADEKYTIMEALELQTYPDRHSWTLSQMDIQNSKDPDHKLALSPIYKSYQEALKNPKTLRRPQTQREQGVTMSLLISHYDNLKFPKDLETVKGNNSESQKRKLIKVDRRDKHLAKSLIQAVGIPTSYIEMYHLFLNLSLKDIFRLKLIHSDLLTSSNPDYENMINMISRIMDKAKQKINAALSLGA